jgi:hypothetical protein
MLERDLCKKILLLFENSLSESVEQSTEFLALKETKTVNQMGMKVAQLGLMTASLHNNDECVIKVEI